MSVVPLTVEGANATVVQRQEDFDVEGRAVLIIGLDVDQLNRPTESNVTYDLRVGRQYRDHREQHIREISENGVITLRPGSAFVIQTEEAVHLPRSMYGIIAPKVSLLQLGLSTTFSKVDPGYPGPLLITLFNLGQTTVTLHRRDAFCGITFLTVEPGARLYQKGAKQLPAAAAKQPRQRLSVSDKIAVYGLTWQIVGVILSALLGLAGILLSLWFHGH